MARVLIVVLMFPPDSVSTAQIFGELAEDLQARGHQVTVLSTIPHYNPDPEAEARQPMDRRWGGLFRVSRYHGVRVYHAWMPRKRGGVAGRLLAWTWFHLSTIAAALTVARRTDVIITPSPPLTNGIEAWLIGACCRSPYVYNVQEIYPDIAVNLGLLRNRWLLRLLCAVERFVYRRAAAVTVIGPGMRERLLVRGAVAARTHVIPNFVDIRGISPMSKDNEWSRCHVLHQTFVMSYAGNFGPAQDLDTVVDAAKLLEEESAIRVLLVGSGTLWSTIATRIRTLGLRNVCLMPQQPYAVVPQIYGVSDVCIVPQTLETARDALPSKVYRIMAAARPIIACTEAGSDLAHLLRDAGCGMTVPPGSPSMLAAAVRSVVREPERWRTMGEAGRRYVVQHYARPVITRRYDDLICALTGPANHIVAAGR